MSDGAIGYQANGFRDRDGEPGSRFVAVEAAFPLRDSVTGSHVSAGFYMRPDEARRLSQRLLRAADFADGEIDSQAPTTEEK